ncbi:MAG: alpha/beta hydrolase [Sandaracinaceae bacterium]
MNAATRTRFVCCVLGVWASGCGLIQPVSDRAPIGATYHASSGGEADWAPGTSSCLLVFLPGIGDRAESFDREGFVEEAQRADVGCDLALVDAHFTYYLYQNVVRRVANDVLVDARARYDNIWLVGISIGGYGAMLTARAHPELVDGVILLAPMIGVPPREDNATEEVLAAGGLRAWPGVEGEIPRPRHLLREPRIVWDWLHDTVVNPGARGRLVLGYGTEDRRVPSYALLGDALPRDAVYRTSGAHDWPTWRALWAQMVRTRPWAPQTTGAAKRAP